MPKGDTFFSDRDLQNGPMRRDVMRVMIVIPCTVSTISCKV